jgi:lipopolysaccharide/colanic/teichoic acid biosynthesis glycosyltransferase
VSKRTLDLLITIPLLAVLSPLLLLITLAIKLTSPGPVLFRQSRVGQGNQPFTMLKFRSMVVSAPCDDGAARQAIYDELAGTRRAVDASFKLAADPRVTPIGRIIRATSLDEITQLLNVVRGEMSLVGPRPALDWEAEAFPAEYQRRTDVPPGITGLWQVSGRSRLSTPQMLQLDIEYIERRSLWLDMEILLRTIPVVIRGDGAR